MGKKNPDPVEDVDPLEELRRLQNEKARSLKMEKLLSAYPELKPTTEIKKS